MNIPADIMPFVMLLLANAALALVVGLALWRAPWVWLRWGNRQHAFLGAIVALLLLWRFDVSLAPGLGFHFLGVTVLTLMFGWSLSVIGVGLASVGLVLSGGSDAAAVSLNALLLGVLPVSASYAVYRLVDGRLPHHLFIYIFLCGFFGAIIAASISVVALVVLLRFLGAYDMAYIAEAYLPFMPLYLFPEGFLNGMLITVFVGLRPEWLMTFDDESYLRR